MSRVVLVTGGASGIGEATARRFAADGETVVIADVNAASGEEIVADGGAARFLPLDVADEAAVIATVAEIEGSVGPIDVLINCAGILENAETTHEMDLEAHDRLWRINYWGTLFCAREVAKGMLERRRGCIVNIASVTSTVMFPLPAYSPNKAAVKALTEVQANEYGRAGIRVNAVAPGYTLTPAINARIQSGHRDPDKIKKAGAIETFIEPRHIADGIHFLCSPAAEVITGVTLPIDAGFLIATNYKNYVGGLPWEKG
jgi:NAD(P)-dependent dehydrogenase (short-subunit alcohol dehydrogenase family)